MFFKRFRNFIKSSQRIYLDYASSTPLDIKMLRSIPRISRGVLMANPSALHREGVDARRVINDARTRIAHVLHAHGDEIIFTSGATESDNLALAGVLNHWLQSGVTPESIAIVSSNIEHDAVAGTLASFDAQRVFHIVLPSTEGIVETKGLQFEPHIKKVLISVMYVNNEIGTEQPIKDIAKIIRRFRKNNPELEIIFHVDATQAPLHYSLNVAQLGVDLMTLGATKLYTHKGVGVLYKKRTAKLAPIMHGGGQEQGLRPGTESVELIHHFAHALVYAQKIREVETARVAQLQKYFETKLKKEFPNLVVTAQGKPRTPHISHIGIPDFDSELLVIELDAKGIAVSAKSACKNEEDQESHIVEQIYGKGWGAVRFSFGRKTTKWELDRTIRALKKILKKYQSV